MHSPGQVLKGRYEITRYISPGAMSTAIYVAKDLKGRNGSVLIKEVDLAVVDVSKRSELESAVLAESMRLKEVNSPSGHPNIVTYYEFFSEGLAKYLVMDFVEGETLNVKRGTGKVSDDLAVDYSLQILSALSHIHSRNPPVVHHDLKLENCIVTPQGTVVVADFGASKQFHSLEHITQNHGTPGHASISQVCGLVDIRSDIYSAGVLLFELLTGQVPSAIPQLFKEQVKNAKGTIRSDLLDVIFTATKMDADDRYQTADEMASVLKGTNGSNAVNQAASQISAATTQQTTQTSILSRWPIITGGSSAGELYLKDITCIGADGKPFAEYKQIYVAKDVIRKPDGSVDTTFTPYEGITYFEKQGNNQFLPSFALTCNILAALWVEMQRGNTEAKAIMDQYKGHGAGWCWHAQNTLVQWNGSNSKVIHYPYDTQFSNNGGSDNVNRQGFHRFHTELDFNSKDFDDMLLENALRKPQFAEYIKNLTGLPNPSILIEIGTYFGKPAKMGVPNNPNWTRDTRAAWLGCSSGYFLIGTYGNLYYYGAARGVRRQ